VFKKASTTKYFRVSPKESDAIVEFMARGGVEKDPQLQRRLMQKFGLTAEQYKKVEVTGNYMFTEVTGPVSNHPVIQALTVTDPITGAKKSVGTPSVFFPQVPVSDVRKSLTKGGNFEMLYKAAKQGNPKLTRAQLKSELDQRISAWVLHDLNIPRPGGSGAPIAGGAIADQFKVRSFPGLEQARLFDPVKVADANNMSVAEVYRTLGYDDDPMRAVTSFTIGGLKRAETGRVYPTIRDALPQAADEIVGNPITAKAAESNVAFIDRTLKHFAGRSGAEVLDIEMRGIIGNALAFQSGTLLQGAFISNLAQLSVVGTAASTPSIAKALASTLNVFTKGDDLAKRSAHNYITMVQEWQKPGSFMAGMAQDSLRVGAFTVSEKFLRAAANRVAYFEVLKVAKKIQETPSVIGSRGGFFDRKFGAARHKLKWDGIAIEMGFDPDELRRVLKANKGVMPNAELNRGVETFVNKTAGRTDMRGLPLWAAEHRPELKVLLQLKNFALVNLNAVHKLIVDAPTTAIGVERAIKAFGLGTGAGITVNTLRDLIIKQIDPGESGGTISRLREEPAKEIARSLAAGLGNVYGMLIASASSGKQGISDFVFGPTGSMAVGLVDTGFKASEGKINKFDVDAALARRIPYAPVLGPSLSFHIREEKKAEEKRKKKKGFGEGLDSFKSFESEFDAFK